MLIAKRSLAGRKEISCWSQSGLLSNAVGSPPRQHRSLAGRTAVFSEAGRFTSGVGRFTAEVGRLTEEVGRLTSQVGQFTSQVGRFASEVGRFTSEATPVFAGDAAVPAGDGPCVRAVDAVRAPGASGDAELR